MPICSRCGTNVGFLSSRSFSKVTERCNVCDGEVGLALQDFRSAFVEFASDGVLTTGEWEHLTSQARDRRVHLNQALAYIAEDIKELLYRAVEMTYEDGVITHDEERYVEYLIELLRVPPEFADRTRSLIADLRVMTKINHGNLPVISPSIYLDAGEICHLEADAIYTNTSTKSFQQREGRLLATNSKLRFVSYQGSFEIKWGKVLSTVVHEDRIFLETAMKQGNGFYAVDKPTLVDAIFAHLIEASRHEPERPPRAKTSSPRSKRDVDTKSPREVLGVGPNATREEVTIAYRHMAKLYHPDKVASLAPEFKVIAETRMKEINGAYGILIKEVI
jgi:DnaJ-domain-containing protein 1